MKNLITLVLAISLITACNSSDDDKKPTVQKIIEPTTQQRVYEVTDDYTAPIQLGIFKLKAIGGDLNKKYRIEFDINIINRVTHKNIILRYTNPNNPLYVPKPCAVLETQADYYNAETQINYQYEIPYERGDIIQSIEPYFIAQ